MSCNITIGNSSLLRKRGLLDPQPTSRTSYFGWRPALSWATNSRYVFDDQVLPPFSERHRPRTKYIASKLSLAHLIVVVIRLTVGKLPQHAQNSTTTVYMIDSTAIFRLVGLDQRSESLAGKSSKATSIHPALATLLRGNIGECTEH